MKEQLLPTALAVAAGEVGVREVGVNRGRRVEEYLRAAHLAPGNPWCAAFVTWCIHRAAESVGAKTSFPRTGYCPTIATWARKHKVLHATPQPGDLFLRWGQAKGVWRFKHTGFVESVGGGGYRTIEGNTSPSGSREGDRVLRLRRPLRAVDRFVRWIDA